MKHMHNTALDPAAIVACAWGLLVMLVLGAPARAADGAAERRLNVLWIITEDMGPELACYGTEQVWTPKLDALASRGMRFNHAFTTAPVCSASRSAFMTGMYQTTIGAHNHRSHRGDGYTLPQGVRVLPDRLREAGYFTANIGRKSRPVAGTGKTDWNFNLDHKPFDSDNWQDLKSHQPFYAQVNLSQTHRPFNAPKRADPGKVVLPPYYPDHPIARQDWAAYLDEVSEADAIIGRILEQLENDGLADNTVIFMFGDHGQAQVRGKQWCYDSGLRIPLIIYWPEDAAPPKQYKPGSVSDQIIEAIDLTATTLAIAGVKKPDAMQGRVFFGPHADEPRQYAFGARDRCDETVFRIRTARDARYRYIRNFMPQRPFLQLNRYKEHSYPMIALMRQLHEEGKLTPVQEVLLAPHRPAEELYDIESDPHEINNLAESPEHREVMARLRQALDAWIETSNDQGATPEPAELIEHWEQRMKKSYDKRAPKQSEGTAR